MSYQEKYKSAMHYFNLIGQPFVLTPHWFDDTFKTQRIQPVERYLFPEPMVFNDMLAVVGVLSLSKDKTPAETMQENTLKKLRKALQEEIKVPKTRLDKERKADRMAVWQSVVATESSGSFSDSPSRVFSGRRVWLSAELKLGESRLESVVTAIELNGGAVVTPKHDKIPDASEYDILIITFDDNLDYMKVSVLPVAFRRWIAGFLIEFAL